MKLNVFLRLVYIFSSVWANLALSDEPSSQNFRELCRRSVSGTYISLRADANQADDAIVVAENFRAKSRTQIELNESKMKVIVKKLESNNYDAALIQERDDVGSKIKIYTDQLHTSETQIIAAKKHQKNVRSKLDSIHKKISLLFSLQMSDDPEGGPRPLVSQISWKSQCPKYRILCPLPENERKMLIQLTDEINDSDLSCHKYSKLK